MLCRVVQLQHSITRRFIAPLECKNIFLQGMMDDLFRIRHSINTCRFFHTKTISAAFIRPKVGQPKDIIYPEESIDGRVHQLANLTFREEEGHYLLSTGRSYSFQLTTNYSLFPGSMELPLILSVRATFRGGIKPRGSRLIRSEDG